MLISFKTFTGDNEGQWRRSLCLLVKSQARLGPWWCCPEPALVAAAVSFETTLVRARFSDFNFSFSDFNFCNCYNITNIKMSLSPTIKAKLCTDFQCNGRQYIIANALLAMILKSDNIGPVFWGVILFNFKIISDVNIRKSLDIFLILDANILKFEKYSF